MDSLTWSLQGEKCGFRRRRTRADSSRKFYRTVQHQIEFVLQIWTARSIRPEYVPTQHPCHLPTSRRCLDRRSRSTPGLGQDTTSTIHVIIEGGMESTNSGSVWKTERMGRQSRGVGNKNFVWTRDAERWWHSIAVCSIRLPLVLTMSLLRYVISIHTN